MSLLMQSNSTLKIKNRLADRVDGAKLSIDFRDSYVNKNGATNLSVEDVIDVVQPLTLGSINLKREYKAIQPNKPVISTYPSSVKKGLIVETPAYNFMLNSDKPVNKIGTFNHFNYEMLVVQVKGRGSVRFYCDAFGGYLGTATEDKPLYYSQSGSVGQGQAFRVEIDGDVDYYQIISTPTFDEPISKISTAADWLLPQPTKVKIKTQVTQELLGASMVGCLVLKIHKPRRVQLKPNVSKWGGVLPTQRVTTYAQITDNNGHGVYLAHYTDSEQFNHDSHRLRLKTPQNTQPTMSVGKEFSDLETVIVAINFTKTTAQAYINGEPITSGGLPSSKLDSDEMQLKDIYLISGDDTWSKTYSLMLEQAVLYSRNLSIQELSTITDL